MCYGLICTSIYKEMIMFCILCFQDVSVTKSQTGRVCIGDLPFLDHFCKLLLLYFCRNVELRLQSLLVLSLHFFKNQR